jgi:hypothetical protein
MAANTSDDSAPDAGAHRYELHFREGPARTIILRYREAGITLSPAGMEWYAAGERRFTDYTTIIAIRVQTGHIPKAGYFGSCEITFRNGRNLTVTSLDKWGSPDGNRLGDYAEFIQDLHGRLSDADCRRIRFEAGATTGRHIFGTVAVVLGGLMFVVLPLGLLLLTGEAKALFIAIGGIAFIVPAFRTMKKNEPRTYDPRHLDEDLFPHT